MLPADVDFAGGRARRADDGLLQQLRRGIGRRAVIVVLLEDLIAGPRVDRERHRRGDFHRREADRQRDQGVQWTWWLVLPRGSSR